LKDSEAKLEEQATLIEELEKRREAAKKEIKLLHAKLQKKQKVEGKIEESKEQPSLRLKTDDPMISSQAVTYMRQIKRELELMYKDLIKVLFSDDKADGIAADTN
jgi:uncharacterized alpha/beta hydrolase family protein